MIKFRQREDILLKVQGIPGPLGLMRGKQGGSNIIPGRSIVSRYSKAKEWNEVEVLYGQEVDNLSGRLLVKPAKDNQIDSLRF